MLPSKLRRITTPLLLSPLLLSLLFLSSALAEARLDYTIKRWSGPYSNSVSDQTRLRVAGGKVDFDIVYLDSAYDEERYDLRQEDSKLVLARQDKPGSASRHYKPYLVEGTISGLEPGTYTLIVERQTAAGAPLKVFERQISVSQQ